MIRRILARCPGRRPRPLILFGRPADPWADSPLWGATGPHEHPLYAPTVMLPIVTRHRRAAR